MTALAERVITVVKLSSEQLRTMGDGAGKTTREELARRLQDGLPEWAASGLPVATSP